MPILFFVNSERTVLLSVKRDLDPPLPPSKLVSSAKSDNLTSFPNILITHIYGGGGSVEKFYFSPGSQTRRVKNKISATEHPPVYVCNRIIF